MSIALGRGRLHAIGIAWGYRALLGRGAVFPGGQTEHSFETT